jgi:hypothetical protein
MHSRRRWAFSVVTLALSLVLIELGARLIEWGAEQNVRAGSASNP